MLKQISAKGDVEKVDSYSLIVGMKINKPPL